MTGAALAMTTAITVLAAVPQQAPSHHSVNRSGLGTRGQLNRNRTAGCRFCAGTTAQIQSSSGVHPPTNRSL